MGGTLCTWEQRQWNELHRLRTRIPAMSVHLWQGKAEDLSSFNTDFATTDAKLSRLLQPFTLTTEGLNYPNWSEGNFNEHAWFGKAVTIELAPRSADLELKYAVENKEVTAVSTTYTEPITIDSTTTIKIAAFDTEGKMIGLPSS